MRGWWKETGDLLGAVYSELVQVCKGALMVPPLKHPRTGEAHLEYDRATLLLLMSYTKCFKRSCSNTISRCVFLKKNCV